MKRQLSILLIAALLLFALAGCTSTEVQNFSDDEAEATENVYANALTAYAADKQVATINGTPVYWNEYAYNLINLATQVANYSGLDPMDWSAVYDEDSGETYGELLQENVEKSLLQFHVIESKAAENGIEFGDEGEAYVQDLVDQTRIGLVGEDGTEEEMVEHLLSDYFIDVDTMRYQAKIQYLYEQLFNKLFGENGEKLSDEDIASFLEESGYLNAKHILWKTTDDEGNDLSDADKQAQLQKAQAAAAELKAISDQEARVARFDEIMNAESEDPGLATYPDGYVFTSGEMYEEFENGTAALEFYEVSDVVTSGAGYHVILRLPMDENTVIDQDTDGSDVTVRKAAAFDAFSHLADGWMEDAEVEWESGFDSLNFDEVFSEHASSGGFFKKIFG